MASTEACEKNSPPVFIAPEICTVNCDVHTSVQNAVASEPQPQSELGKELHRIGEATRQQIETIDWWKNPAKWVEAPGKPSAPETRLDKQPKLSPEMQRLLAALPNDWTALDIPDDEYAVAMERIYENDARHGKDWANETDNGRKELEKDVGLKGNFYYVSIIRTRDYFDPKPQQHRTEKIKILAPNGHTFVFSPPTRATTEWNENDSVETVTGFDHNSGFIREQKLLDKTIYRKGRTDATGDWASTQDDIVRHEEWLKKVMPVILRGIKAVTGNKPYWLDERNENYFHRVPGFKILDRLAQECLVIPIQTDKDGKQLTYDCLGHADAYKVTSP